MNKFIIIISILVIIVGCKKREHENIRIAYLTDIHVEPGNMFETALEKIVAEINTNRYNLTVVTGDLTNMGSEEELLSVKRVLDKLDSTYYVVPGNHETTWSDSGTSSYAKIFGEDRISFKYGNYQFIGFNCGPYMRMSEGLVKQEDIIWIDSTLTSIDHNNHIINLAHYPINEALCNWKEVASLFKRHNVAVSLCGHGHKFQLMNFGGIPGVMGRASIGSDSNDVGYNSLELFNDSIKISSIKLGGAVEQSISWDLKKSINLSNVTPPRNIMLENINEEKVNVKWQHKSSSSILGGFSASLDKKIASARSDGKIELINSITGEQVWSKKISSTLYSTPIIDNNHIYIGTPDSVFLALSLIDGEIEWQTEVDAPIFSEAVVEGNNIYVGAGKAGFYKIDKTDGKIIWSFSQIDGFVQAKPTITKDLIIFGAWDKHLYAISKKDGEIRWKWNNGKSVLLYSPGNVVPAVIDDKVYIVAPDRHFTQIDLKSGKQLVRRNNHKVRESMAYSTDRQEVYAKLMNDSIVIYRPDGEEIEEDVVNCGFGYEHLSTPMVEHNGVLYGGTRFGSIFAVDLNKKTMIWRYSIGRSGINKLEIKNEILYSGTMGGNLIAIEL